MNHIDLSGCHVVDPNVTSLSLAYVNIYLNRLSFNLVTAADLRYPATIEMLFHRERRMLALVSQPTPSQTSIDFITPERLEMFKKPRTQKRIVIRNDVIAKIIREIMGWNNNKQTYRAYGVRYLLENAVIFNLDDAQPAVKGIPRKATVTELLSKYPFFTDSKNTVKEFQPLLALSAPQPVSSDTQDPASDTAIQPQFEQEATIIDTPFVEIKD